MQQGASTLMISLPSKWIKHNQLQKGAEIDLEEHAQGLLLYATHRVSEKKTAKIELTKENKANLQPLLTHYYRKGFDTIRVHGIDSLILKEIRSITSSILLGFEITQSEGKSCVLENVTETHSEKYDMMIKRIIMIVQEQHRVLEEDCANKEYKNNDEMSSLKNDLDKFVLYCRRIIEKTSYTKDPITASETLLFFMHIGHAYFYLYKYAQENKFKAPKEYLQILKDLKDYLSLYIEAYEKISIEAINQINTKKEKLHFGSLLSMLESSKGSLTVIISYTREIFRLIQIGTSPLLNRYLDFLGTRIGTGPDAETTTS